MKICIIQYKQYVFLISNKGKCCTHLFLQKWHQQGLELWCLCQVGLSCLHKMPWLHKTVHTSVRGVIQSADTTRGQSMQSTIRNEYQMQTAPMTLHSHVQSSSEAYLKQTIKDASYHSRICIVNILLRKVNTFFTKIQFSNTSRPTGI